MDRCTASRSAGARRRSARCTSVPAGERPWERATCARLARSPASSPSRRRDPNQRRTAHLAGGARSGAPRRASPCAARSARRPRSDPRLDPSASRPRRHTTIDAAALDDIFEQVTDAIREVRRIVDGLQPSILEDLGLVPALQILINDVRDTTGLDITFQTSETATRMLHRRRHRRVPIRRRGPHQRRPAQQRHHMHSAAGDRRPTASMSRSWTTDVDFRQPRAEWACVRCTTAPPLGGTIDVDSRVGDGTRVAVRLPT